MATPSPDLLQIWCNKIPEAIRDMFTSDGLLHWAQPDQGAIVEEVQKVLDEHTTKLASDIRGVFDKATQSARTLVEGSLSKTIN
jgi:hypothetical protein